MELHPLYRNLIINATNILITGVLHPSVTIPNLYSNIAKKFKISYDEYQEVPGLLQKPVTSMHHI